MEWLTPHEAFAFETHGFCVIEDVVSPSAVARMNDWLDAHPESRHVRSEDQMLDGRQYQYHKYTDPTDERYYGSTPAARLTGSHGREDFRVPTHTPADWTDPNNQPFTDLIDNAAIVRWMLATIGEEFRFEASSGLVQTNGSEGFVLHGRLNAAAGEWLMFSVLIFSCA